MKRWIISIVAVLAILWLLFKCLATAWVGMKLLPFVYIVLGVLAIGWVWGKLSGNNK